MDPLLQGDLDLYDFVKCALVQQEQVPKKVAARDVDLNSRGNIGPRSG